jgi:chemotaxis protein CheZ
MKTQPSNAGGVDLGLESAHGYLDRVIGQLGALGNSEKQPLLSVLQYLSNHIRHTRDEIGALRPGSKADSLISSTADELEEIVAETARAANEIMAAAETIETLCAKVDPETAKVLTDAATRIYEASAFQDITSQRITKIVRALQHLETKLGSLVAACGPGEASDNGEDDRTGDAALLNGPQLSKGAASQADIDSLFDSLG